MKNVTDMLSWGKCWKKKINGYVRKKKKLWAKKNKKIFFSKCKTIIYETGLSLTKLYLFSKILYGVFAVSLFCLLSLFFMLVIRMDQLGCCLEGTHHSRLLRSTFNQLERTSHFAIYCQHLTVLKSTFDFFQEWMFV
jgi:hypothetical protein